MLNKCMVIGRLGADPELRYTANGNATTTFRVASSRTFKDASGKSKEETEWFRVVTWSKLAEICAQYLAKGKLVYVEGRLQTRSWENQQGVKQYTTDLVAQEVKFLGGGESHATAGFAAGPSSEGDIDPDDLPFAADPSFMGWQDEAGERVS